MYYLDTSCIFSLYVPEKQSDKMLDFVASRNVNESLFISRLTEVEFYSALANKMRTKSINKLDAKKIANLFNLHLNEQQFQKLHVTDEVFSLAMSYLEKNVTLLRTLDALHLACSALNHATLLTSDKAFFDSAKALNVLAEFM